MWCLFWHDDTFILHSDHFFKQLKKTINKNFWGTVIVNKQQSQMSPNPPRSFLFFKLPLSLSSLSRLHFYPPSIHSLHSLDCVTREVRSLNGDYTYVCDIQKTTCVLARRVSDFNLPQWLTSYAAISHSSPDCHLYLLFLGDCLIKFFTFYLIIAYFMKFSPFI